MAGEAIPRAFLPTWGSAAGPGPRERGWREQAHWEVVQTCDYIVFHHAHPRLKELVFGNFAE
jgi:hypothetical protein